MCICSCILQSNLFVFEDFSCFIAFLNSYAHTHTHIYIYLYAYTYVYYNVVVFSVFHTFLLV